MRTFSLISLLFIIFCSCYQEKTVSSNQDKELLINNYLLNISYGIGSAIDSDEQLLLDSNMNLISFNDLLSMMEQEKLLIFKYDTKSCNACLNQEMSLLSKLKEREQSSMVLLVSTNNVNEFKIIREKYKNILNVYGMKDGSSIIPGIEASLLPYYFLAEQDKPLRMVFIPDKNLSSLSRSYLNYIFTNYIR